MVETEVESLIEQIKEKISRKFQETGVNREQAAKKASELLSSFLSFLRSVDISLNFFIQRPSLDKNVIINRFVSTQEFSNERALIREVLFEVFINNGFKNESREERNAEIENKGTEKRTEKPQGYKQDDNEDKLSNLSVMLGQKLKQEEVDRVLRELKNYMESIGITVNWILSRGYRDMCNVLNSFVNDRFPGGIEKIEKEKLSDILVETFDRLRKENNEFRVIKTRTGEIGNNNRGERTQRETA
jgi:hypothetical protein